jgi:hypothetical protein
MLRNNSSMSSRPSSAARFFLSAQNLLKVRGGLAALRTVGLIDDHSAAARWERSSSGLAPLFRHFEQLAGHEGELLKGGDDDGNRVLQRLRKLARAFVDLLHHAAFVLELVYGVLELLVQNDAIGDDDYAIENALARGIVEGGEAVRQPADGVAFSAAGGMLDQVVVPDTLPPGTIDQQAHGLKLVVARGDHGFDLHLAALIVPFLFHL